MKKILALSLVLIVLSAAASAQAGPGSQFRKYRVQRGYNNGQLTRSEKFELRKDVVRYQTMKRRATRDGVVTPFERRKLRKAKCEGRRDLFRFRHNGRRRVI
ncbi:MAG: hypothetical protein HZB42_14760 [Sphingobacteriales bacterium]|nr:hypothetical protein [Sphingobacteriales bacterium]